MVEVSVVDPPLAMEVAARMASAGWRGTAASKPAYLTREQPVGWS